MSVIPGTWVCETGTLPFLTDEDRREPMPCCYGSIDHPDGCTCWEPIFDLEQQEPRVTLVPGTRARRCHDCAYRPDSPERERGDDMEALDNFWCHQGIRRAVAYRHPDGRVRQVPEANDYQPPMGERWPFKADGTPADRCAGWAQTQRLRAR